jgi:hypothetical protein
LNAGKFQDAMANLLAWLAETEDTVANQKPPSPELRVVKAQLQEQKVGLDLLCFSINVSDFAGVWIFCVLVLSAGVEG